MAVDFNTSKTKVNLMRAFAGESQARNRYTFSADKAKKMGYPFIANIFTITANQEKEHAEIFYNHLKQANGENIEVDTAAYPVGNFDKLDDLLLSARHNEYEEYESVYPDFARTARDEGFPEIAYSFEKIAEIEKTHGDRFECFAKLISESKLFTGDDETEWLCLNCGHIYKGKAVPKLCPVCNGTQGYFVPYKYYKFIAEKYGCSSCEV